jgi:ABC-2 type transport system ATP-binding protein
VSIRVEYITKTYGKQKALDSVSLEIKKGEITGFLGPNGAGKTTLMKILTGYLQADSGDVWIEKMAMEDKHKELRAIIGYLPEHNPLYPEMFVKEFLSFSGKLQGVKNLKNRVSEMIQLVGLEREQHKRIGALSKGYRQRVGLASAIIHDPKVLILDEPTTGLDPNQIVEVRNLIQHIGQDKTVLLSTHIMQEVEAMCKRAIIIHLGTIVSDQYLEELKKGAQTTRSFIVEFESPVSVDTLMRNLNAKEVEEQKRGVYSIMSKANEDLRNAIFDFAVRSNNPVLSMQQEEQSLESIFKSLTQ